MCVCLGAWVIGGQVSANSLHSGENKRFVFRAAIARLGATITRTGVWLRSIGLKRQLIEPSEENLQEQVQVRPLWCCRERKVLEKVKKKLIVYLKFACPLIFCIPFVLPSINDRCVAFILSLLLPVISYHPMLLVFFFGYAIDYSLFLVATFLFLRPLSPVLLLVIIDMGLFKVSSS